MGAGAEEVKMVPLRPFFSYFGSKHSMIKHYPPPLQPKLIEPFAGSAAYACWYHQRQVQLYDADPVLFGVWDYLIKAPQAEILALPVQIEGRLEDLKIPQEARWLIGFCEGQGYTKPKPEVNHSKWFASSPDSFWGAARIARIAYQQAFIRHWQVFNQSYETIVQQSATWFIDPPYYEKGKAYNFNQVDYTKLGQWCRQRKGQVIVCEEVRAPWLDFQPLTDTHGLGGKAYVEGVWLK